MNLMRLPGFFHERFWQSPLPDQVVVNGVPFLRGIKGRAGKREGRAFWNAPLGLGLHGLNGPRRNHLQAAYGVG
jgi:hypothetical protein